MLTLSHFYLRLVTGYHDGHVKCSDEGCYGFLLADYVHDFAGDQSQFFRRYQRDRPEPVTIISNTDAEGAALLNHAHARLAEFHLYENQNASYTGFEAETAFRNADPPEFAVMATWNIGVSLKVRRSFCACPFNNSIHVCATCL